MKKLVSSLAMVALVATAATTAAPAMAKKKKKEAVALVQCEQSLGTIAVVDGDTQGWADFDLGSPRALVNSLATESGCFTPHNAASGVPADFLMNVVAGTSEQVDQSIETAKGLAMDGLVRSGAAGSLLGRVPGAGAVLGMFGGFGGKKKRVAAGIKLLSPMNGQTIVTGQGVVKKSTLSFGGGGAWNVGAQAAGYGDSKKGKMLVEAFVIAFNELVAQEATIASVPKAQPAVASAQPNYATVAAATSMMATPATDGTKVRDLMVGTTLTPTGKREGLFVEVKDNFGTTGWVSVESLN
ncbi:MAG: SH3 domain-containing protein [Pseudomonadota bacterium]|nr:SH3 domain-containing protein [Pseudomonadota bacterium]